MRGGETMATIKQIIAKNTGAGSRATQYKKSARVSARNFGALGKFGARGRKNAKKGNLGSMGG